MLKCWKRTFAFAVLLGWSSATALAQPPAEAQGSGSPSVGPAPCASLPDPRCCSGAGGDCNGSSCFDSCNDDRPLGVEVGATMHVLRPAITNNTGLIDIFTTTRTTTDIVLRNFDYDYQLSPSVWASWTSECGLGFRATWFRFQENSRILSDFVAANETVRSPSQFIFSPPDCLVTAGDGLFVQSWDFDVTQTFCVCKLQLTAGAGIRWLRIDQTYNAINQHVPEITETEADANSFRGVGPTLLLEGHRPIGCGGLSLYANSRIGLLFGNRHESSVETLPLGDPARTSTQSSDSDQLVGFVELELGIEWAKQCGRFRPFVRAGIEGRGYFGTGNAQSGALVQTDFTPSPGIPTLGHTSDVGLYGMAFSAGVRF